MASSPLERQSGVLRKMLGKLQACLTMQHTQRFRSIALGQYRPWMTRRRTMQGPLPTMRVLSGSCTLQHRTIS